MKQHKPELAFQVLERSRAQSLREMLANARINIRQGVDPGLLERERSLQSTINIKADRRIELTSQHAAEEQVKALTKEIEGLLGQYEELEGQIRLSSPSFAALTQPKPLSAKEVQLQLLDSDTLLLEYALGEKHSYIFVLTPTSLATYELPKRAEIETAARQVYASVTNGTTKYPEASGELSRMVLGPVAAQLAGKRLLIVGDGALEYVPFAILPVPRKPGLHLANGNRRTIWLIEEHEIVYSPSASVLISLRHEHSGRKPVPGTVAVLADPVFTASDSRVHFVSGTQSNLFRTATASGKLALSASLETGESRELRRSAMEAGVSRDGSLSRLPYTRKEAEAITTITGPKKTVEHLDFDASRENALSPELQDIQIVHFATHGLIDTKHPELSGLVFSLIDRRGQPQDGFLRLSDIYNLRLNADLVVLSACSTALGKEIKGEGLVGLTRGFLYAGASHVVASLWEINDFATAELMEHFYRAMRHDGLTPAAALRAAQIHMLHEWQFPYYWAAFELQGDWR
jgi:CHAT domain-containing protein